MILQKIIADRQKVKVKMILKWKCNECGDILHSDWDKPRKMDWCKCGKAAVDLEHGYTRTVGSITALDRVYSDTDRANFANSFKSFIGEESGMLKAYLCDAVQKAEACHEECHKCPFDDYDTLVEFSKMIGVKHENDKTN